MDVNDFLLPLVKREMCRPRHPEAIRAPSLYPSSASAVTPTGEVLGSCWRADWYRIHGVSASDLAEFYMQMIYALGKCVELEVVDAMKRAGMYESNGVKFYHPTYGISGELDIVGRYKPTPDTTGYYLVEVKSVYGMGATTTITGRSKSYKGQPAFAPYPKESNIMQVMLYIDYFDGSRGERSKIDFCKLLYIPRDKPTDGREYTVSFVTLEDLTEEQRVVYKDRLKPNHRYAYVQTKDHPSVIEERFSLEDIYARFSQMKVHIDTKTPPPRAFKKFYSPEEIEEKHKTGGVSATAYTTWEKKGKPKAELGVTPGHYLCQSYCDWRSFCYDKKGLPSKEADKVGLVQIDEPRKG